MKDNQSSLRVTHFNDPDHYNTSILKPNLNVINFYSRREAFGEFSNFAYFEILVDGVIWPTTEHYYQAHKFMDLNLRDLIRKIEDPAVAAQAGRDPQYDVRDDWNQVKDMVMKKALVAKFTQHKILTDLLLSTEDKVIHEHTENDHYWGDGKDGTGKDMLGKMLMEIRNELRA